MKLLLVIIGALIVVNGTTAEPNSLSEADIRRIAMELLKQVKSIKEGVQQIPEEAKDAINLKLKQIPEVKKVNNQFIQGLISMKLDVECAVSIDKQYHETLETITAVILRKTLKNITNDEDYLNTIQKNLDRIQTILEQNMDQEVKKCIKDIRTCNIMGEFIESTGELFKFVDLVKLKILNVAENEVSSENIQNQVKTYLANVPKCLTEQIK